MRFVRHNMLTAEHTVAENAEHSRLWYHGGFKENSWYAAWFLANRQKAGDTKGPEVSRGDNNNPGARREKISAAQRGGLVRQRQSAPGPVKNPVALRSQRKAFRKRA